MKVLLVGGGGREHALALMILRSTIEPQIYVASPHVNPGLRRIADISRGRLFKVNVNDGQEVLKIAEKTSPDLIIIGPEEPQFAGVVDTLCEKGFTVFGATARLAEIEKNKVFARKLMWKYDIPGRLWFKAFKNIAEALEFAEVAGDVVIKPARQAGGKGVKVLADVEAYLTQEKKVAKKLSIMKIHKEVISKYRDIDYAVLIEQRVEGVEYTIMTITDGKTLLALPLVQDHPHAFEMDLGPETGGMGSISGPGLILPFITKEEFHESLEIVRKSLEALQNEVGDTYRGALAGQMMLTPILGPTLIEFYSRFGDPEIANILPVIESDFLEILDRAATGRLAGTKLKVKEDVATVVKVIAPAGYPQNKSIAQGHPISIDEQRIREIGCIPLYASLEEVNGELVTLGSRAIETVCWGSTHEEASRRAELAVNAVKSLDGWPLFHRSDIGSAQHLCSRIMLAERVRITYTYRRKKGLAHVYNPFDTLSILRQIKSR